VDTFNGSNAAIADYLMEDVLARQDAPTCRFLLQTSVLHDLSASLCDFVLERSDSSDMLMQVERAHLFLVAQDSDRRWYRYHALFSEFLQPAPTAQSAGHGAAVSARITMVAGRGATHAGD